MNIFSKYIQKTKVFSLLSERVERSCFWWNKQLTFPQCCQDSLPPEEPASSSFALAVPSVSKMPLLTAHVAITRPPVTTGPHTLCLPVPGKGLAHRGHSVLHMPAEEWMRELMRRDKASTGHPWRVTHEALLAQQMVPLGEFETPVDVEYSWNVIGNL